MAKRTAHVGDDYPLEGPCLVKLPDGSVVTAARTYRFTEPGKWEVIYADSTDAITVRPAPTAEQTEASGTP